MVEIEQTITIKTKHHVLDLTMDEAIELKDALIRAVGAQTHSAATMKEAEQRLTIASYAPGEAEQGVKRECHCGAPGWGRNGCCGVSGCNNVPA